MNLFELLSLPSMKCLKPVAGQNGLSKSIHWVYVAECLDYNSTDISWINGGELIFITGKNLHGGIDELIKFIFELNRIRAAGLVINIGPYIPSIPDEALKAANEVSFPLFELSWDIKLVDLTQQICRKIITDELEIKSSKQIIEALLFQSDKIDEQSLMQQAYMFGYDLKKKSGVGVLKIFNSNNSPISAEDNFIIAKLLKRIADALIFSFSKHKEKILISFNDVSICFVFPTADLESRSLHQLFNEIIRETNDDSLLKANHLHVNLGIGGFYIAAFKQRLSFAEAEFALKIIEYENMEQNICFFAESGIYQLLFAVKDSSVYKRFYENTLFPLDEYDKLNKTLLSTTLKTYLDENCNMEAASKQMFIHRNTLKYRLEKIETLTGLNLKSNSDRSLLWVAYKMKNII